MAKKTIESNKTLQVYGINNCSSILKDQKFIIKEIILSEDKRSYSRIIELKKYHAKIKYLNKKLFDEKYGILKTQGIVVNFTGSLLKNFQEYEFKKQNSCLLILDQITDPQNAGQIIRTSECAGIDGIIFPKHDSFNITNTVLSVSQGAFVNMPLFQVININKTIKQLKDDDFWIVGLENGLNSQLWNEINYSGKIAIVVGSEGSGIRKKVLENCDFTASIPMQGFTNSLNVSAAVSAILFERLRQIQSL